MTEARESAGAAAVLDLLATLVRGAGVAPSAWASIDLDTFAGIADTHGVLPLVAERLSAGGTGAPAAWLIRLSDLSRRHLAEDLAREVELRAALTGLNRVGLRPLVFKGAHLAYRDYARPDLRPRTDSDILIPADAAAREAAHEALTTLGYATPPHAGGDLVMTQRMYVKREGVRVAHALDLHWRIATPQAFSRVVTHSEILTDAEVLPRLHDEARGPSGPHALLIACLHRIAHHAGTNRLIWLCDIDRIARRLSVEEWRQFAVVAGERGVRAVCDASLARAEERLHTPVPGDVRAALGRGDDAPEVSARYLAWPADSVTAALEDLRALSSWKDRARLLREHLLPPAAYMRDVYAPGSRAPLAWLYVRRVSAGLRKWRPRRRAG